MRHQIAALECWNSGKYRESATNYWLAFRGIPSYTHEARYHIFHGYTSTLRGDYFEPTDDDVKNMELIFRDKHEPRLFRLEAGYTLGVISYSRSERLKCQDFYHHAITIGEKQPKNSKEAKLEQKKMIFVSPETLEQTRKTMKELMDIVLKDCQDNLNGLHKSAMKFVSPFEHMVQEATAGVASMSTSGSLDPPMKKTHAMPIGRGGTSLTEAEITNLIDVGGLHCDCCKCKSKKLLVCERCKKAYYCSAECQKKQWKENDHKIFCRKEGEFKAGDLVQIARLKNKAELNENIMRIVGPDPNNIGRYEVRMEGGVEGDKSYSIAAVNLNQLRPYDCRK